MADLRSFQAILQREISVGNESWAYKISNLPRPALTDAAGLIKCLSFVSSLTKQQVQLRLQPTPQNRVVKTEPLHLLLIVSFSDFKLVQAASKDGPAGFATAKESAKYIATLLRSGIVLNGTRYHFFGHSNSQLKSRACFMLGASKEAIAAKVEALGDFSGMKSVGKKAKRIGLLFSSAKVAIQLDPERTKDIPDIVRQDYIFTDGCGLISNQLAKQVVQRANIIFRNKRYLPSVFQIRYRGYKGVLTRSPALTGQIQIHFRQSMKKFGGVEDYSFSVVDHSRPYAFGYLNDEIILLLHALGIQIETLLRRQQDYLQFLQKVSAGDPRMAFQFLSYSGEIELAEKLLLNGIESVHPTLRKLVTSEHAKMVNKRGEQRCRIMIPQSRLLFGVCDPSGGTSDNGKLKPGTCFVRITEHGNGEARTLVNTEVLVTRNPCLHPGDLQKFKVIDVSEWAHLTDCIVFPITDRRPSADLMSGGDLDGDRFFVTWDADIVPRQVSQPAAYPGVKEKIEFEKITDDRRADFFAGYSNASLGRVKNLYLKWARLRGPMSPECQQLNRLFSQCVDGNRINVPSHLEDPPEPPEDGPPFVLDVLHAQASDWIGNTKIDKLIGSELPESMLDFLANRDCLAFSEFELIQMLSEKCSRYGLDFSDYSSSFNYAALSDEQQMWLLNRLPPRKNMPRLIRNGLLQSQLVHQEELKQFKLDDHRLHWKPVFASKTDRMGRFLGTASRALENFHKKLIVIQIDERLTLMIYIPQKIAKASETQVDSAVRVFGLPRSSGHNSTNYRVIATKEGSRIFSDENVFQLYERAKRNTFIFLTKGQSSTSSSDPTASKSDRRHQRQQAVDEGNEFDCRASVALQKISAPIQKHVGRTNRAGVLSAEIYVISNRDVESMRVLDAWLQFVDTEEVLPIFQSVQKEYRKPSLDDIERSHETPDVQAIVWNRDLSRLPRMSVPEIRRAMDLLLRAGEKVQARGVYAKLLAIGASKDSATEKQAILSQAIESLRSAVSLSEVLLASDLWVKCKAYVQDDVASLFPTLLAELIRSAPQLGFFIVQPFQLLLKELKQMSMHQLADLAELIALSVDQADIALDLLLECIEGESSRLLPGRPIEIQRFVSHLIGIALNHIDEAAEKHEQSRHTLVLEPSGEKDGFYIVKANLRIDVPGGAPKIGDHIRLLAYGSPTNAPAEPPYRMNAVVLSTQKGSVSLRCINRVPPFVGDCTWKYQECGSFITSKAMLDALTTFYTAKTSACWPYEQLVGVLQVQSEMTGTSEAFTKEPSLNASQNEACAAAFKSPLALLWGPPGTGKTQTIVVILKNLLRHFPDSRFLVTAPTHNAVDNILQRYIAENGCEVGKPLRVSTSIAKVASALRQYTCDALLGKDLSEDHAGRRKAQKQVKQSQLVFTTCVGAALGLLRTEKFDIVIVDEASQQTEPETLIPLTKGCRRAILVGDHIQLRATVQKHAVITSLDVSLFERLYRIQDANGAGKVMLDTQYRMHPDICAFSSALFYDSRLKSAEQMSNISMPKSVFPWPTNARKVFIQSFSTEDLGRQSKSNEEQVALCRQVCDLLSRPTEQSTSTGKRKASSVSKHTKPSIVILTPYTKQRQRLQETIQDIEVSSIDGFQGREADIVVFVTVRCNVHGDIGFLKDLRRLNVAMTRAKAGVIVIGDRMTLTGRASEDADAEAKAVWQRLLDECTEVKAETLTAI